MAKAVTFGIMYGAGPKKISEQVTKDSGKYFSTTEAKEVIEDYFSQFHGLKTWLDRSKQFIQDNGFIYSYFEEKEDYQMYLVKIKVLQHMKFVVVLTFLVQSIASDVNLLGAIDSHKEVKERGMRAQIFALVHDSILAEVDEEEVEDYCEVVRRNVQKDRGISIPGTPIGCDFDIGEDYSFGKFTSKYGDI